VNPKSVLKKVIRQKKWTTFAQPEEFVALDSAVTIVSVGTLPITPETVMK
jgi:hypothetical protein